MNPYLGAFAAIRRAYPNRDYLVRFTPEESRHIIVARKGLFYVVPVYHPDGSLLSKAELERYASGFSTIFKASCLNTLALFL